MWYGCSFQRKFDKFADHSESFEVFNHLGLCSLDIITQCAFSYKTGCQTQGYVLLHWLFLFPISNAPMLALVSVDSEMYLKDSFFMVLPVLRVRLAYQ